MSEGEEVMKGPDYCNGGGWGEGEEGSGRKTAILGKVLLISFFAFLDFVYSLFSSTFSPSHLTYKFISISILIHSTIPSIQQIPISFLK